MGMRTTSPDTSKYKCVVCLGFKGVVHHKAKERTGGGKSQIHPMKTSIARLFNKHLDYNCNTPGVTITKT
jgi:hypothetical protein